ncbi:MAG: DUF624 domain-containing protein [Defluviitaleaceae bacterium]|nr:DUF624 domain-containing protein [Defluviitaleaceae bacterium]
MRDFFSLEGPFNKYGGLVADMIILSFMWLFFSVIGFGITIGASTSAMFYVSTRRIANREGYITRDFWEAFKANFKKATILWLIAILLMWLIWFNVTNIDAVGGMAFIILPAQIILFVEITFMSIYAFPMIARFDMGLKQIIKTSFFMANRHMLTSLSCVVLLAAGVLSFFIIAPLALFLAPGLYATLASYMIMRIFKKYRPEMDKDPVLEIQEIEAKKAEERRWRDIGTIDENEEQEKNEGDIWTNLGKTESPPPEEIKVVETETPEERPSSPTSIIEKANNPPPELPLEEEVDIWRKLREMDPGPQPEKYVPKKKPKKETTAEDDFWASV